MVVTKKHAGSCGMLHFVTSFMNQNKNRKPKTLESAQYGLETFNQPEFK